ncbi:MAG: hypothetical protein AAF125_11150, partial [Chloroflexota bacterium]
DRTYHALGTNSNAIINTILNQAGIDLRDHMPQAPTEYPGHMSLLDGNGNSNYTAFVHDSLLNKTTFFYKRGGDDTITLEYDSLSGERGRVQTENDTVSTGMTTIVFTGLNYSEVVFERNTTTAQQPTETDELLVLLDGQRLVNVSDFYTSRSNSATEGAQVNTFEFQDINYFRGDGDGNNLDGSTQTKETLLEGFEGDDILYGGTGNDTLIGGLDDDELFGGEGEDTADYSTDTANGASAGISVTLNANGTASVVDGWGDTDTLTQIEIIKAQGAGTTDTLEVITAPYSKIEIDKTGSDDVIIASVGNTEAGATTWRLEGFESHTPFTETDDDVLIRGGLLNPGSTLDGLGGSDDAIRYASNSFDSTYQTDAHGVFIEGSSQVALESDLSTSETITNIENVYTARVVHADGDDRGHAAIVDDFSQIQGSLTFERGESLDQNIVTSGSTEATANAPDIVGTNYGDTLNLVSVGFNSFTLGSGNDVVNVGTAVTNSLVAPGQYFAPYVSNPWIVYTGGEDEIYIRDDSNFPEESYVNIQIDEAYSYADIQNLSFQQTDYGDFTLSFDLGSPEDSITVIHEDSFAEDTTGSVMIISFESGGHMTVDIEFKGSAGAYPYEYSITESPSSAIDTDLSGGYGNDEWTGRDGIDETYSALAGDDRLEGGSGDDNLFGGSGSDHLRGGADDDTLDGGAGDDVLNTGSGDDTVTGGTGSDIFIIEREVDSYTLITDFDPVADVLDLRFHEEQENFDILYLQQSGTDTLVNLSAGQVVRIENTSVGDFNSSNVNFAEDVTPPITVPDTTLYPDVPTQSVNGTSSSETLDYSWLTTDVAIYGNGGSDYIVADQAMTISLCHCILARTYMVVAETMS